MHVALTQASTNQLINKSLHLPHLIFDQYRIRRDQETGFRFLTYPSSFRGILRQCCFRTFPLDAPERNSTTMITDYVFRTLAYLGVAGLFYVSCNLLYAGAVTIGIRAAGNAFAARNSLY